MPSSPTHARSAAALLLAATATCLAAAPSDTAPPLRKTLGAEGLAVLEGPDGVEVYRVEEAPNTDPKRRVVRGYAVLDRKDMGPDYARRLARVLLGDGVTEGRKKCGIDPGVAFRVRKGDRAVDVLVCFNCDVVQALAGRGDEYAGTKALQDSDPARAELLRLSKEAFPDRPEIQSIPAIRKR